MAASRLLHRHGKTTVASLAPILAVLAMLLAGCGGSSSSPTADTAPPIANATTHTDVGMSDLQIAMHLYSDDQRTPSGFLQDMSAPTTGIVATLHLKNTDLSGSASGAQFELCTDDWNQALAWSDQTAVGAQASTLVETNTTSDYFEFGRVRSGTTDNLIRARIFRCAYVDRSNVDLRAAGSAAGFLNRQPATANELRSLSEYLWRFTMYNNYGNAVLKSEASAYIAGLGHTLTIATLSSGAAGCDRIDVIGWTHTLNSQTGALLLNRQTLFSFGARRQSGVVELCTP